jgi:hypothetical protein
MAGKKVRCSCGTALRLPTESQARPKEKHPPQSKKRHAKQTQAPPEENPLIDPFELNYSDLDDILAGSGTMDADFQPARRSPPSRSRRTVVQREPKSSSAFSDAILPEPARSLEAMDSKTENDPHESSSFRHRLIFVLALVSSITGCWFASFLILSRLVSIQFPVLSALASSLSQIYSAEFGLEEISSGLRVGLLTIGWLLLLGCLPLLMASLIQATSAVVHVFSRIHILRWVDGLMATLAISIVFLLIGALFLHHLHIQKLQRQVNQVNALASEGVPGNVVRLREQYQQRSDEFTWSIVGIGLPPMAIFGCSILRMLARPS